MHNIKQLTDREHILTRPNVYIGSITTTTFMEHMLADNIIQYKEVKYNPGLIKIINEIIDNSIDVAIKTNFKHSNLIQVTMNDKRVVVQDNGTGIPVIKNSDGHYLPELCWNFSKAGSNFGDDENRTQIGTNGIGSYATACFSKKFIGTTDDGKKSYKITIKNNASEFTEEVGPTGNQGTIVSFFPDLERFGVTEIDETHQNMIKQRLINLSIAFPEITFKFNHRKLNTSTFRKYVQLFNPKFEIFESDNFKFAILPNESDDFRHFSYVNGLKIPDGGVHIDTITNTIVNGLRDKLKKKYKTIKPGDIRNKLMVIAFIKNFPNTKFNSQSKEKLTNSIKEFNAFIGEVDYDKIINKILKTPEIIDNITEVYRIKEEFNRRKELKAMDKTKKKKPESEKFMPPIGLWKRIFVCEGDSAANSISKLLGRDNQGFYAMFGVPPNAYSSSMSDILKSKKMTDLKDILGIKYSETVQNDINFKEIIITTDYDLPGHFIAGQLIGLIYRFGKNLFTEGRVKRLVTPLLVCTDSREKIITWFYTFEDFKAFEAKNKSKKYHYDYKKGLGSWDQEELSAVISKDGLENMLETYDLDDLSDDIIEGWLGNDAQKRKDFLNGVSFDIMAL